MSLDLLLQNQGFQQDNKQKLLETFRAAQQRGDRAEVLGFIKQAKQDPALADLSEEQIGMMLNRELGGQEKASFDRFRAGLSPLESLGYMMTEGGREVGEKYVPTGKAARGLAGLFTDDKDRLDFWEQTGEYIPAGVAMIATSMIPGVGLPAMSVLAYGSGAESARARGVGGAVAPVAGAIDAAVNLAFVKIAPGVGNKVASKVMEKAGMSKALMAEAKLTGDSLFETAKRMGNLSPIKRAGLEVAAHTLTESGMAAAGTVSEAAKELMLYANEGRERWLSEWWEDIGKNPDFWAASYATEMGFAAVGHVVGRTIEARTAKKFPVIDERPDSRATIGDDPAVTAALQTTQEDPTDIPKTPPESAPPLNQAGEFKTSRGSTYAWFADQTSQRNQVAVPEEGVKGGTMVQSKKTVFVSPDDAQRVGMGGSKDAKQRYQISDDGKSLNIVMLNEDGTSTIVAENVPIADTPAVGSHPIELRNPETREGNVPGYRGRYTGTPITDVKLTGQQMDPTIPTALADDAGRVPVNEEAAKTKTVEDTSAANAESELSTMTQAMTQKGDVPATEPKVLTPDKVITLVGNAVDVNTNSSTAINPAETAAKALDPKKPQGANDATLRRQVLAATPLLRNPLEANLETDGFTVKTILHDHVLIELPGSVKHNIKLSELTSQDIMSTKDPSLRAAKQRLHEMVVTKEREILLNSEPIIFNDKTIGNKVQKAWKNVLVDTGLENALNTIGAKIVFSNHRNVDDWYFKAKTFNKAQVRVTNTGEGIIFTISGTGNRQSDLHEFGHVISSVIKSDGYGIQARIEFEALLDQIKGQRFKGAEDLVKALHANDPENAIDTPEKSKALEAYYREREEQSANAVAGYFLGKPNKFKTFIATNFPTLDKLITGFVKAFNKNSAYANKREQYLTETYMPEYRQFKSFFDKLFSSEVDQTANKRSFDRFSKKHNTKLSLPQRELLYSVYNKLGDHQQKAALSSIDKLLDSGASSEVLDNQLQRYLKLVDSVNRFAPDGVNSEVSDSLIGDKTEDWLLWPNAQRLVKLGRNHRAVVALQLAVSEHIKKVEWYGGDTGDGFDAITQEIQRATVLIELDSIVGKWINGDLPGQDGVPMYEKGMGEFGEGDELFTMNRAKGKNDERFNIQDEVQRMRDETSLHYPILWKNLRSVKSGKSVLEQGFFYLGSDGNPAFVMGADKVTKKQKRFTFNDKAEAEEFRKTMQNSSDYHNVIFTTYKTKEGWQIKGTKDKLGVVSNDWEQSMESQQMTDWIDHSFENDSEAAEGVKNVLHKLMETEVPQEGLAQFLVTAVRRAFNDYENGALTGNENGEFRRLLKVVEDFDKQAISDESLAKWKQELYKEFGVSTELNTKDLLMLAIVKEFETPGLVSELNQYAPKAWTDMVESYGNLTYGILRYSLDMDTHIRMDGEKGKFRNAEYRHRDKFYMMAPVEFDGTQKAVGLLQEQDPTARNASMRAGVTHGKPRGNLAQRTMNKIERAYHLFFGNMIQIGESHTYGKVFGEALTNEQSNINVSGTDSMEYFSFSGKEVDGKWVKDLHGNRDDTAFLHVHSPKNPELTHLKDEIQRVSQVSQMTFDEMVGYKGNDPAKLEQIGEFKALISEYNQKHGKTAEQDLKYLREFMLRSYAAKTQHDKYIINFQRQTHLYATAHALFKSEPSVETRPEHAVALAKELAKLQPTSPDIDLNLEQRLQMIMEFTGWDKSLAFNFDKSWKNGHARITKMGVDRITKPWYVTERRHRQWLVPYVVENGKDGTTGMRDFDTPEEAMQFIRTAKNQGLRPMVKRPKDSWAKREYSKGYEDSTREAIGHVIDSQAELMDIVMSKQVADGKIDEAAAQNAVNTIKGLKGKIEVEMANAAHFTEAQRFFKHGREHMDMTYQQMRGFWQDSIKYSRDITNSVYQLFMDDPVRAADSSLKTRATQALQQLRIADGQLQQKASKAAFTMFMAGNVSTGLIELAQFPLSLSHILVENGGGVFDSFRIPAKLAKQAAKASFARIGGKNDSLVWVDPHHVKLIRMAERMGRMNVRNYMDISENVMQERIQAYAGLANQTGKGVAGTLASAAYKTMATYYGACNRFNAELSLTSTFEVLRKKKYGNKAINDAEAEELYTRAMEISDLANGAHGRVGRPIWFNNTSEGMRTVAQLGWSLQSYSQSYVSNWLRLITSSFGGELKGKSRQEVAQARKALALMTGIQLSAFGALGIPLVGGISKALQLAFGFNPEHELKEFLDEEGMIDEADNLALVDAVLYGAQRATGSPIDIRSRLAVSGIGPLSEYEGLNPAGLGGPLLGLGSQIIAGMRNVQKGDDELARYGVNLLPAGMQRSIRMMFFDDGKVFTKAGKYIMTPTTTEKVGAFLGFSPTRYIDHVRATSMQRHAAELDSLERSRASNDIMKTLLEPGGEFEANRMLDRYSKELNYDRKQLANSVANKMLERLYGPQMRQGSGPNAERASRLYQSPLPQVSETTKALTRFKTLSKLQHMPQNWENTLQKASTFDYLMQNGLNRSEARNYLNQNPAQASVFGASLYQPQSPLDLFPSRSLAQP